MENQPSWECPCETCEEERNEVRRKARRNAIPTLVSLPFEVPNFTNLTFTQEELLGASPIATFENVIKSKVKPSQEQINQSINLQDTNSMSKLDARWDVCRKMLECKGLRTAYIWGPPGIGKTYGAQRWGLQNREVYTITLTEETPAAELRGHFIPKGGEFVWHDGPVSRAMREGARLVLNEVAHAACDVLSLLYAVLESPETSKLTLPTGEILRPASGFQCIITDNISPKGLPGPLQDRLDVTILLESPSPEAINGFPKNLQKIVLDCASAKDPEKRISLRSWEAINRLTENEMDFELAAEAVMGERWGGVREALKLARAAEITK